MTTTAKRRQNRIIFILDRSGSMRGILPNAIDALNNNIRSIREAAARTDQDATVSLITFDTTAEVVFFNRSIEGLTVGRNDINAGDLTALFDAVGLGIERLRDVPVGKDDDVSYLVIAITDGFENASRNFTDKSLRKLMLDVQGTDAWTLSFLVPNREGRRHLTEGFQIPEGNVMEWEATSRGVQRYEAATTAGIDRYFQGRASGEKSSKSFYVDMRDLKPKDVKRQLDDLSSKATVWHVNRDAEIREFVEAKGVPFVKGAAFYQLTKREQKVQDYKKVLIMEKGKPSVFGGDDARDLMGLPDRDTPVLSGQHGDFEVFIQSTSTNRKVLKGTKLIYMPSAAR